MENLWPDFNEKQIEKSEAVPILRDQARNIKKQTNDKVRATFSKMEYKSAAISAVKQIGDVITAMSMPVCEEVLEDELKEKQDINDLFEATRYKFEIFNDEYRFRLFVLNNSELFPITLDVDSGILEEISYKNRSKIESNGELKSILKEIFSCPKVYKVISRMCSK